MLKIGQQMICNEIPITVLRFLGKGKGGYSYLVQYGKQHMVLKKYHYEPCEVYTFEADKLETELRDYNKLVGLGIPVPNLVNVNHKEQYIIKEYIDGPTLAELAALGHLSFQYYRQIKQLSIILYEANGLL